MSISLSDIRNSLASAGDPWDAGITSVSLLSDVEKQMILGVMPPAGEKTFAEIDQIWQSTEQTIKAEVIGEVGLPAAYDLRNVGGKNFITPVKNQLSCGSCVAFGIVATAEGRVRVYYNNPNYPIDLSEADLFFCIGSADGATCSTGWWPQKALDGFKSRGVVDDPCFPYDLSKKDCSKYLCSNWGERVTKITGYTTLTGNAAKIKEWITTNGPVSACFVVYDDFFNYKNGIYKHVSGGAAGGHCVTVIGYNDNPGYWICKNSWGTGWGMQGFFNIAYGQCGIETWLNHGIDSIVDTGWRYGCHVIGLWTIDQDRNAWVYFDTINGWRKVSPDNDNIFFDMLRILSAAKATGRPVNFYENLGVIKQVYVI